MSASCRAEFIRPSGNVQRLRAGGGYNNILTLVVDPEGMCVSVFVLFRFGHPPLFIPWEDVSAKAKRVWWVNMDNNRSVENPM